MRFLKRKIIAGFFAVTAALGIQVHRAPVYENKVHHTAPDYDHIEYNGGYPHLNLVDIRGATPDEEKLIREGTERANSILESACFKDKFLSATFTENNGLANDQIYAVLSQHPIDIGVEVFTGSAWQNYVTKTMGYDIGDGYVYANRFYIKDRIGYASLEGHETAHALGFHHYEDFDTSVPYQINDIMEECDKELK